MVEIGIGVLFAILFVAAYLLISRLFGAGDRWREIADQPLRPKSITARPGARLFLTAEQMREHHSKAGGKVTEEK